MKAKMRSRVFSIFLILVLCITGCGTWQGMDTEGYRSFQRIGGLISVLGEYQLRSEDGNRFFLYDQEALLCWKWECSHMNGDCPAYYHRDTALLDVDAADRLILLEGQTFDAARQNQVILWRIDPELHRKESLGTFTLDEEAGEVLHWKSWCVEGNTLYMEANLSNRRAALLVGNLKNGESGAFLPPVDGEKTIEFVGIEGGRIYWKEGDNSLWYWDQEVKNLFQGGEAVHDVLLTDHWIVYNETRKGRTALYALDVATREESYLCDVTEYARLYAAPDVNQFYILEEPTTGASLRLYDIEKRDFV